MDHMKEMKAFMALVEQGGFAEAAREVGVPASTITIAIATLETRLGVRLLNRIAGKVSPTETGLVYYGRAKQMLTGVADPDGVMPIDQVPLTGRLRICVAKEIGILHVAPALGNFHAAYPDIMIDMTLRDDRVDPKSGMCDLAIGYRNGSEPVLRSRKLARVTKRLIAAPAYFERYGRPAGVADLADHTRLYIADHASGYPWKIPLPSGDCHVLPVDGGIVVNDAKSLLNACIAGLGIAYVPSTLCQEAMDQALVENVIADLCAAPKDLYAIYLPSRQSDRGLGVFLDFVTDLMSSAASRDPAGASG